jgi:hypothetical protein
MVTWQFKNAIYLHRTKNLPSNVTGNTIIPYKDQIIKFVKGKNCKITIIYRVIILFGFHRRSLHRPFLMAARGVVLAAVTICLESVSICFISV